MFLDDLDSRGPAVESKRKAEEVAHFVEKTPVATTNMQCNADFFFCRC